MRKKLLVSIIITSLLVSLTGCANNFASNFSNKTSNNPVETYKNDDTKKEINESNGINASNINENKEAIKIKSQSNLHLQKLAEKLGIYKYANHKEASTIPIKVLKDNNNLTFKKDKSSNSFLYTTEKFNENINSGLLILIFPDEEKDGDKTYHTFKISSINLIKNGGTGTIEVGRIYSDGTIKTE
ncbi:hypothetical protein [Clostridium tarantellae]|uniref:Lipoprotein n=1 Tax=Clostridium tarantellae TaxID=39493 RepID=A0A6I1MR41_9CLOT|nr:hypothetical protein [Clostridium tarantellae]MPQ44928.1 hypothetical protein [Clostridium tarantellae]